MINLKILKWDVILREHVKKEKRKRNAFLAGQGAKGEGVWPPTAKKCKFFILKKSLGESGQGLSGLSS